MTNKEDQALARPDYWDSRYARGDGEAPTHEWFRSFGELESFFRRNLLEATRHTPLDNPLILHLGSGDSVRPFSSRQTDILAQADTIPPAIEQQIPAELSSQGYARQLCVDFSPVVVSLMSDLHSQQHPGITWKQADVRDMHDLADGSVDIAFDKGTLDAMIHGSPWSPPDEVRENTGKYMREVHRVLKEDGLFLYVTFRQPHFIKPLLDPDQCLWDMDMQILGDEGSLPYYGFNIRKKVLS